MTLGTTSKFQKPTFNIILPFSSILAAAEIRGVTLRGWEIRARFPAPHLTVTSGNPVFIASVLSSAGPSSHFHVAACSVPPSYLCNGCTTGHGSHQGNVFHGSFFRGKPTRCCIILIQRRLLCSKSAWISISKNDKVSLKIMIALLICYIYHTTYLWCIFLPSDISNCGVFFKLDR